MARVPLYKAAETEMIRRIETGEWPIGLRLPNEFGLADEFGVSQGTMRRALMTLEGKGFLTRKPGRGTIVSKSEPVSPSGSIEAGFDRLRDSTDAPPELSVFRARSGTRGGSPAEQALFGTGRLSTLERTLKSGATRAALDDVVIPEFRAPVLPENGAVHLPDLLLDMALPVARIEDDISAAMTTMGESVALSTDRHTALLVLTRTAFDDAGAPMARQVLRLIPSVAHYSIALGPRPDT